MTTKARAKKFRIKRDDPLFVSESGDAPASPIPAQPTASTQKTRPKIVRENMQGAAPGSQTGLTGEVTSADEMTTDQQIAAIRKEGLTGRQLRIARRVAQKHGLAPTSDFDAVRLLRAQGIDPFQRSNVLEIVKSESSSQQALARVEPAKLPQTVAPREQTLPSTQIRAAEARAGEIYKIQRDIAKRRRRKLTLLLTRLAFFVLLPTFLAGWYYAVLATPLYSTKSEFLINKAEAQGATGLGGLLTGTTLASQQDSTTVQSYLKSRDAMLRLDNDHGFKAHFQNPDIDPIQRLEADASNEAAYKIYNRNIKIGYDPSEGILKMEVIATTPDASQAFSEALIAYAEERVDGLTQRIREDQMRGANEAQAAAKERVRLAQTKVLDLQEKVGILNPLEESTVLLQRVAELERINDQKQLELEQQLSNRRPNAAKVNALEGEISRLQAKVTELRATLTETVDGNASLARITGELRLAEAELQTEQLSLQSAATQVETAMAKANSQVRYLSVGVSPTAPDVPTYPRVFENTALAFLIFAGIYLMISLTASILREQVSA